MTCLCLISVQAHVFRVFELPHDEPPPPTIFIGEFIRHEVPRLVRSQVEEQFVTSKDAGLTGALLTSTMIRRS